MPMSTNCIKKIYPEAFVTVLAISSEARTKQCLKRIPDLVRSRTDLLTLTTDQSIPTIRVQ